MSDFGLRFSDDDGDNRYEPALVCLNGHVVNWHTESQGQDNIGFCEKCGKSTISQCPACKASIRGMPTRVFPLESDPPPAYCNACGVPYPWTAERIAAAKELADVISGLTAPEREQLKTAIDDLVGDTVRTPIGIAKFNGILGKAGKGAKDLFKEILIGVISDITTKALFGA